MANLYGRNLSRAELLRYAVDVSQVGGVRQSVLLGGPFTGVEAVDFRTGSGLDFTVLPSRGMDISYAEFNGKALCMRSTTGDVAPQYYEREGLGWLRGFQGGLFVTGGLSYMGHPCVDEGEDLGLHGPASYIPAQNVWADAEWEGDDYVMWVQGKVRETSFYGVDLVLKRRIWTRLGEKRLWIDDVVTNLGHSPMTNMMLYHFNIGYPVLDENAVFLSPTIKVTAQDDQAAQHLDDYYRFEKPVHNYPERVYLHELRGDVEGNVTVALVNAPLELGVYLKYNLKELPWLNQWKNMSEGSYVLGMEPATGGVGGRAKERAAGRLRYLQPGESAEYHIEFGVLSGRDELAAVEKTIEREV